MSLDALLRGRVRGIQENLPQQGDSVPRLGGGGEWLVLQSLPPLAEIVRMGNSYAAIQAAAVAPVTVLPSTTAQVSLWNGEADNGKSYVIDSVFGLVVVSAAAATNLGFAAMLNTGKKVQPAGSTLVQRGLSGKAYGGKGAVVLAATVTDDGWVPLGPSVPGPASQIGMSFDYEVNGLYIVPPGGLFSMAALANTVTTITVRMGLRWHEVPLALG